MELIPVPEPSIHYSHYTCTVYVVRGACNGHAKSPSGGCHPRGQEMLSSFSFARHSFRHGLGARIVYGYSKGGTAGTKGQELHNHGKNLIRSRTFPEPCTSDTHRKPSFLLEKPKTSAAL